MTEKTKILSIKTHKVFLTVYMPDAVPAAIVQINHGLAEHSLRYQVFARYLCQKGYAVYVHDHPGHGQTAGNKSKAGHLPWEKGWDSMLDVIHGINKSIRKNHPGIPVFLFGHSMGSLLSRHYNAIYPMYFKGIILSGTSNPDLTSLKASLTLVKVMSFFKGEKHKSRWLNNFFYRKFNKAIAHPKTDYDWLSSDPVEVEKYLQDDFCGFQLSLGFFKNLLQGTMQMLKTERKLRFRKNLASLIISGKHDPVGQNGKEPRMLQEKYKQQGYFNTHLRLIEGRHELLNEIPTIRIQTYEVIAAWIESKLKGNF